MKWRTAAKLHLTRTIAVTLLAWSAALPHYLSSQTASSGAIRISATDSSGAGLSDAKVTVTLPATGEVRTVSTARDGSILIPLLPAGVAHIEVSHVGFDTLVLDNIQITVTETRLISAQLRVGSVVAKVEVTSTDNAALQTDGTALGDVVSQEKVVGLPLSSRNFTQIIGLSAGVESDVTNAGDAGRGQGGAQQQSSTAGNTYSHGDRGYDNDFQMNGLQVNDIYQQGGTSGGVPIPDPDTVQEFKVQTSQYDASFGRRAGASVDLITRGGGNQFHGNAFDFFRNTDLNANNYFAKRNGQSRAQLNQDQFGGTLGGPVLHDRLFFFGAYQGTRQIDAVANVTTVYSPALTNDRSASALGSLFQGMRGYYQDEFGGVGPSIQADGSNINSVALQLLQAKQTNGSYLIPTPQTVDSSSSFSLQGQSTFSPATHFNENQYMGNSDYEISATQRLSARFFTAGSNELLPEAMGDTPSGYSQNVQNRFVVSSLQHTWILSPNLLNEFRVGYNRTETNTTQNTPLSFSDLGITAPTSINASPYFSISGSFEFGGGAQGRRTQNAYLGEETLVWTKGRHSFRFGGGAASFQRNLDHTAYYGEEAFESFPDFLLGLDAEQDGTSSIAPIGNVIAAVALTGNYNRANRAWEAYGYAQDDYRIFQRLTLNLGVRYDWLPPVTDASGRQGNLDTDLMDRNPGSAGSLEGVTVSSNFPGTVPQGVRQTGGRYIYSGKGDGNFGPRVGFAWIPYSNSNALVLRGGYGIYYSRLTGQVLSQGSTSQPFGTLTELSGTGAGSSTEGNPFGSSIPTSYPNFTPYSSSTSLSATVVERDIRPGIIQQLSFGTQSSFSHGFVLEVATVDTHGTHLQRTLTVNQASLASAGNPIRGVTTNTVDNASERAQFLGYSTSGLNQVQSEGANWYNDLEVTLRKQLRSNMLLQFAYTWSKTLDTDGIDSQSSSVAGSGVGNQVGNHTRYGTADYSRPQRFVASYFYNLPFFREDRGILGATLGGWSVSGVTTIQEGHTLTVVGTNTDSAYGMDATSGDRAEVATDCPASSEGKGGTVQSKVDSYFNTSCFFDSTGAVLSYPVIGDDGVATDFGNSSIGAVRGPAQNNYDVALLKRVKLPLSDASNLEFRTEFFNAFNTPQFSDPDLNTSDSSFGAITSTAVSPRIIQFALKINF
jgi:hypothetical protein